MKYVVVSAISLIIGAIVAILYMPQNEAKTVIQDRIVTITKRIKSPDGTEVVEEKKIEDKKSTATVPVAKPYHIVVSSTLVEKPMYMLTITRDVLGPISVGAFVTSEKSVGLAVGISF